MKRTTATRLTPWVAQKLKNHGWLCVAGSVGCALAAIVILALTWQAIWLVLLVGFSGVIKTWAGLSVASTMVLGLFFVAYLTANWAHLESMKFESEGHLVATRAAAYLSGNSWLALAGPQTAHSFVKVISLTLLLGPALCHLAIKLAWQARVAWQADPSLLSKVLVKLLKAEGRVSWQSVQDMAAGLTATQLLGQLRLFDGVILLTSEPEGLTITDYLHEELVAALEQSREDELGAE